VDAPALEGLLALLTASGEAEVHEAGVFLAQLTGFRYEVRAQGSRVMLQLWTGEQTLVRQVLRIEESSEERLLLEVQRFGRSKPSQLELLRRDAPRQPARLSREKFRQRFQRFLAEQFADETVASLTAAPDLEHSFSGNYTRGVMGRGTQSWAVLAAGPGESAPTVDAALSFGLLWLEAARGRAERRAVAGLRLFLPAAGCAAASQRLRALATSLHVELYEVDAEQWRARRFPVSDSGNLATHLRPHRETEQLLLAAQPDVEKIVRLSPDAVDTAVPAGTREVALRWRGLEFARWRDGRVEFGLDQRRELTPGSWSALERLVKKLAQHRHPAAEDSAHPLYRAQPERWLETMIHADPARLDARLRPDHLYAQTPAITAGDRGVLDLLGVTREGRLAVIEVKASEDIHLPLQAADYWLRVRLHQQQGDFARLGYFRGVELQATPPLLYLVAPGFRFHPSTDALVRCLSPEIEVARVGLNEAWRRGLQVVFRQ
jgi:hypothetical protein